MTSFHLTREYLTPTPKGEPWPSCHVDHFTDADEAVRMFTASQRDQHIRRLVLSTEEGPQLKWEVAA